MLRPRRRKLWQWLPWIGAALLVIVIGVTFARTVGHTDYVAVATSLRNGDPANDRPRDPMAALQVLDRVLEDEPGNYGALVERARAWADLRAWGTAVKSLEAAAAAAPSPREQADALTLAMDFLIQADDFEGAMDLGRRTVELQPDDPLRKLRLGTTILKGSLSAQQAVVKRFVDPIQKSVRDVETEERAEAFVTDHFGTPDLDAFLDWLMPGGDAVVRQDAAGLLHTARDRFRLAAETLAGYRQYGGFDPAVARAWVSAL
ncbi:MAG TPA: hypothetical protein VK824_04090, partial [Planctomycetota bacterium]|nr:hypothetical protein [Planctomycetota bacterium]